MSEAMQWAVVPLTYVFMTIILLYVPLERSGLTEIGYHKE